MAKKIKSRAAKHDPDEKDDVSNMHSRFSFKALLGVVKKRSFPWKDIDME